MTSSPHTTCKRSRIRELLSKIFCDALVFHSTTYRTSPNKCACLNKHHLPPNFWVYLVISQKVINQSQSKSEHLMLRYSGAHAVNFIEIWQGWEFDFCLRARCIYLAKYGNHCIDIVVRHAMSAQHRCAIWDTLSDLGVNRLHERVGGLIDFSANARHWFDSKLFCFNCSGAPLPVQAEETNKNITVKCGRLTWIEWPNV